MALHCVPRQPESCCPEGFLEGLGARSLHKADRTISQCDQKVRSLELLQNNQEVRVLDNSVLVPHKPSPSFPRF